MDPLKSISSIASSGLRAQGTRLQVVAENVANAETRGATPGADRFGPGIAWTRLPTGEPRYTNVSTWKINFGVRYDF